MAWESIFDPTHSLLDSVVRGTIVYLGLFALIRLVRNRRAGGVSVTDLLLVTLVGNALQNGLVGKGHSITEGIVSTFTVFFWSFVIDWLAFHFPRIRWIAHSGPRLVIRDGTILQAGLRREMLTEEDLRAQLRIGGISDLANIKEAYIEENGQLSVLQRC